MLLDVDLIDLNSRNFEGIPAEIVAKHCIFTLPGVVISREEVMRTPYAAPI
jgi:hypothetical protein